MSEPTIHERLAAPFEIGELKFYPGAKTKDGAKARVFTYIDARAVMDRLDEVVGPGYWQTRYTVRSENDKAVECTLGILMDGIWVEKADVGYPNEARDAGSPDKEPYKAAYSDALKRAAVQFGIGRYIYSLELANDYIAIDQWGKFTEQPRLKGAPRQATENGRSAPQEDRQPSQPLAPAVTTTPAGKDDDAPLTTQQIAEIKNGGLKFRKWRADQTDAAIFEKYHNHIHELSVKGAALVLAWLAETETVAV